MARPDAALLDPARYPYRTVIEPRYGDLDTNMHFNNVALLGMLEEARVRFHRITGYYDLHEEFSSMMANMSIDYLGQGFYPHGLEVHVAAAQMGRTSHTVNQLAMQDGRVVAFARSVIVSVREGRPVPLPQAYHDRIGPWMMGA